MKLQQGDIIIRDIKGIPWNAAAVKRTQRGFVLAEGEATGHAHVIEEEIELYEAGGTLYIRTRNPVTVKHEEHGPVSLPPGIYSVSRVREYDPFAEEARWVRD